MDISEDKLLLMYERRQILRTLENRDTIELGNGRMLDLVLLYAGEEVVVVSTCVYLTSPF